MFDKGWINRQFARIKEESNMWPQWMKSAFEEDLSVEIARTEPQQLPLFREPPQRDYAAEEARRRNGARLASGVRIERRTPTTADEYLSRRTSDV